jgi:ribosome-binding protein aMBF1 (putative translation factor)
MGADDVDSIKVSERTRRQLEAMPPQKRAEAEAILARTQTPEFRAQVALDRAVLDREYRETGTIATMDPATVAELRQFFCDLRAAREAVGLSLADLATRSGIDEAALSRLENGRHLNPTIGTLRRYARALGKRLALVLEEAPVEAAQG